MQRYWARIALGALLIFCLGLGGLAAIQKGKSQVRILLASAASNFPLRFANLGFRLDGRRIGEVTGLDILRTGAGDIGRVTGHVQLTDSDAAARLRDCSLTVEDLRHVDNHTSFSCASAEALDNGALLEVGEVVFQPGDLTRPLYLPEHAVAKWRASGIRELDAKLARDGHGGVKASGNFDVLDHNRGPQRGSFDLRADSDGAVFSVRDEQNRPLVSFRADKGGLNLNVRDRHGRNLLRLLADSLGVALSGKK